MAAKIAVFGERYSSNFGDAVIPVCTSHLVQRALPDAEVGIWDLSCRSSTADAARLRDSAENLRRRGKLISRVARQKQLMRALTLSRWAGRVGARTRRHYSQAIAGADVVILGGGQMLMDNALHYPLRLNYIARRCESERVPLVVHACGVEGGRSRVGAALMRRALLSPSVRSISCRDNYSSLCELLPEYDGNPKMFPAFDSAVWAAEAFSIARDERSELIGLGVVSPFSYAMVAARSGNRGQAARAAEVLSNFWRKMIVVMRRAGYRIRLFANSGDYDYSFAEQLASEVARNEQERAELLAPRPCRPEDVLREIAGCRAIIAHRLHANIIAFSLGVPSIGIAWDNKVADFGSASGRARFFTHIERVTPDDALHLLEEALEEGVGADHLANLKRKTEECLRRALANAGLL